MNPSARFIFLAAFTVSLAGAADVVEKSRNASRQTIKAPKKMRMNEPMDTEMMKQGMKKGDVKDAADRRAQEMQPMMEQEEKSMSQSVGKPDR